MSLAFDTNVLVYATQTDEPKGRRARELLGRAMRSGRAVLLLQSLGEFAAVAIRKGDVPPADVAGIISAWRAVLPVANAEAEDVVGALGAVERWRLSFWDALLWATARRSGVRYLLTEDFQDGARFDGVIVVNPFLAANDGLVDGLLPR